MHVFGGNYSWAHWRGVSPPPAGRGRISHPPAWVSPMAALSVALCLAVMALPAIGNGHAIAYRALYLTAYLLWTVPLAAIQRALWRRGSAWWVTAFALLATTYAMAVANNILGIALAKIMGWGISPDWRWPRLFSGLDDCWLALIAFCAINALFAHYVELQQEQSRHREAMLLARDAELRALRYQLRPHFLFNTLNAISGLISEGRNPQAEKMVALLGDFLRATLDGEQGHETTLADELALTETYLEIEKARLGDRLRLKWSIGPDVLHARVPCLLLQPLVENAVRHGLAKRSRPGRLEIEVYRKERRLHLRLYNDGPLAERSENTASTGIAIGLKNISERLQRLYPGDHVFETCRERQGGFAVSLEIPLSELVAAQPVVTGA